MTRERWLALLAAPPWVGTSASPDALPPAMAWALLVAGAWLWLFGSRQVSASRRVAEICAGAMFGATAALEFDPVARSAVGGGVTVLGWAAFGGVGFAWVGLVSRRVGLALVGAVVASLLVGALPELGGPGVLRTTAAAIGAAVTPWTFEVFPVFSCALTGAAWMVCGVGGDPGHAWTAAVAAVGVGLQWLIHERRERAVGGPTQRDALLAGANRRD